MLGASGHTARRRPGTVGARQCRPVVRMEVNDPGRKRESVSTSSSVCAVCGRAILPGMDTVLRRREMVHLECPESNTWPGGMRELLCLNCGRAFESDSKAQRLCRRCRVGSDFTLR
jgi:hypothetical protein